MVFDCHTHVGNLEHFSPTFVAEMVRAWGEMRWPGDDLAAHRAAMSTVDGAIVLAMDAPAVGMVVPNEYVSSYVATDPGRLIGFASVDPNRPDAIERLESAVEELGLSGLKVGPIYQHFDPISPRAIELFRRAEQLSLPVLCHQGTTFVSDAPLKWARPFLIDEVARRCPDLKLFIAHLGHPWCEETMVVIRKHPNLYADVSALHTRPFQLYMALRSAIEYRVTDKLLFGSDFPFATADQTAEALRAVNGAVGAGWPPIPGEVIEGIIHRPTLQILGLDE
ncbi:MAG: amidohydrolase family protein [bacterium]|nr:amidohydrolase family protein [bacterium]MDE0440153.1 amidohydrolase family protein [bacterium]